MAISIKLDSLNKINLEKDGKNTEVALKKSRDGSITTVEKVKEKKKETVKKSTTKKKSTAKKKEYVDITQAGKSTKGKKKK